MPWRSSRESRRRWENGKLSYSKVRAITRVADEGNEGHFLSIALHGTAHHVETLVRCYRRAKEAAELGREARQHANRGVMHWFDHDGSLIIRARLPAEAGALFLKALESAQTELPPQNVSAETSGDTPRFAARRADALTLMADVCLRQGAVPRAGGDRHEIVVHVDAETLGNDTPGRCGLEHGPALAAETARRLCCDAGLVLMTDDAKGDPLNVGRKTRTIPPALRRALQARDRGCCFPGCPNRRYVDGHHVKHWAHGGATKLSNLVSLCHYHHRQVHEGGMTVSRQRDGTWRFVSASGQVIRTRAPVCTSWKHLLETHADLAIRIDPTTAVTRWTGERMDYGLALESLLSIRRKEPDVSAETRRNA